jgi:hypothetical protein
MDVLFLVGAAVIGTTVRFWRGVAIAGLQLAIVIMAILDAAFSLGLPMAALGVVYVACTVVGFVTYMQGLKLDREHPRRETCELLGAGSVFGMLGVVVGVAIAFMR